MKSDGTPITLQEAINKGLTQGPLNEVEARLYLSVKDFLAQQFTIAICQNHDQQDMLMKLYERLTSDVAVLREKE